MRVTGTLEHQVNVIARVLLQQLIEEPRDLRQSQSATEHPCAAGAGSGSDGYAAHGRVTAG
jgi:hypothetical protein